MSEERAPGAPPPREAPEKVKAAVEFCRGLLERLEELDEDMRWDA